MRTGADLFAIGEVAEHTGVAVTAVRYYDEIGLIKASTRVGGKRRFSPETVGRINFIRQAQQFGMSLEEIRMILDEQRVEWQSLIATKLEELRQQRANLESMIAMLTEFADCGCKAVTSCPALPMKRADPKLDGDFVFDLDVVGRRLWVEERCSR